MTKNVTKAILLVGIFFAIPFCAKALNGTNAGDVEVKIYAELGDDWFRVATKHTDSHGVLELKDAIPGWYRMEIDEDDQESGQYIAARIRMRDKDGARIKDKTDVDVYIDVDGTKTYYTTLETDDSGWIETLITPDLECYLDVDEEFSVSDKEGRPRIKVKAKVDDSDWFQAVYKRTDQNKVLEVENVLPAKYKFKYKSGDAEITDPFTLKIRMVDEKGKKIKKPTKFKLYGYIEKQRVLLGEVKTDARGWLILPGTMTGMKYKIKMD